MSLILRILVLNGRDHGRSSKITAHMGLVPARSLRKQIFECVMGWRIG